DGNGSHASTLKSPSYTKSVSWQHYLANVVLYLDFLVFLHHRCEKNIVVRPSFAVVIIKHK
ncbi:hypothetical protein ACPB0K_22765, partial [Escherichia coli]|uniref:hypothetical protein n=1 Tax=Escherichia coli TaxID=562 RepID=UPI003C2EE885